MSVREVGVESHGTGAPSEVDLGRRLQQVLVARFGWEAGLDAWQDAMAFAWEHRLEVASMSNPAGYLYRVAQTSVRRDRRWYRPVVLPVPEVGRLPEIEPKLVAALAGLSERQRLAVLLVHAHDWTHEDAAAVLDIDVSTLRNHLRRGLAKLRRRLGVS